MFKNWTKLFTTDCFVILLKNNISVYPIFKNGKTSLFEYAKEKNLKILKNEEIKNLKEIKIFLRNPEERFISGVHTVIEFEKIKNIDKFLTDVENFKKYDRHFMPQFYWLVHLSKYYNGFVNLLSINELYNLIPNRDRPNIKKIDTDRKIQIQLINNKNYVDTDYKLIKKYMNQIVDLKKLIKEFKNAVS